MTDKTSEGNQTEEVAPQAPDDSAYDQEILEAESFTDTLIGSGRLVRIGNLEGAKYIHEFNGLRLVPLGYPVSLHDPESTTVWIAETPESTMQLPISERTANLLWSNEPGEDIPATAIRISSEEGDDLEIWGRSLEFDLPALIDNRLAWLSEVSK